MSENPSGKNLEDKENWLVKTWEGLYGITTIKDNDPLALWVFKITLRLIFIFIMIALSPVIILGLILTFFMAL